MARNPCDLSTPITHYKYGICGSCTQTRGAGAGTVQGGPPKSLRYADNSPPSARLFNARSGQRKLSSCAAAHCRNVETHHTFPVKTASKDGVHGTNDVWYCVCSGRVGDERDNHSTSSIVQ